MQRFIRLRTQWRHGFNGPTGLDYGVVFSLLDRAGHTGHAWGTALDEIQLMELAALDEMRKKP